MIMNTPESPQLEDEIKTFKSISKFSIPILLNMKKIERTKIKDVSQIYVG